MLYFPFNWLMDFLDYCFIKKVWHTCLLAFGTFKVLAPWKIIFENTIILLNTCCKIIFWKWWIKNIPAHIILKFHIQSIVYCLLLVAYMMLVGCGDNLLRTRTVWDFHSVRPHHDFSSLHVVHMCSE